MTEYGKDIRLTGLTKKYGTQTVLDVPSLAINAGELIGLVGNNGAGKTTMMRLMLDLIQATEGYAEMAGMRVDQNPDWKSITGSFLDSSFLIDFYTPEEFFGFVAEAYGIQDTEMKARLGEYEGLMNGDILGTGKLIRDFSNGNRQKIGIIAAMLVNPAILILDEPFNYLDPSSQIIVAKLIQRMNREMGTTVVVSSHNLNSINDICDRIILLDKGRVLMDKAHELGLEVLLETHSLAEMEYASLGADMVGINNRNLGTFHTDVANSYRLASLLPKDYLLVSESGISNPQTVRELREAGFRGFLIGETFMKTENPGEALKEFIKEVERSPL